MSEEIKHECGIALIRLLKPLDFYAEKYGTAFYALNKLYLLMEKQHNRGQDGAGIANVKLDVPPGNKYISIQKSNSSAPIKDIFSAVTKEIEAVRGNAPETLRGNPFWLKDHVRFSGELFLGHLRYGTYGSNSLEACHPFLRESNWISRTLITAGNFNMTNTDELFQRLVDIGQHPKNRSDSVTILERIGHFLDEENTALESRCRAEGMSRRETAAYIARHLDVMKILRESCRGWDGGYVMGGLIGHGDAFVLRDPNGIRPAYYYLDDEVAVVTSERPPILTAFNVLSETVHELPPGHVLVIRRDGRTSLEPFADPVPEKTPCSFERIYFSRGTDADIYRERKELGRHLMPRILQAVNEDIEHTVFSFIPNTAESCFYGLSEALRTYCCCRIAENVMKLKGSDFTQIELLHLLHFRPRFEKIAVKDVKMRTFIADDSQRNDLVTHVYDITYDSIVRGEDTLVVVDDSIVRGTTMKESILKILDRLGPKKIIVASSAPQIRYPDCYGIDMARLGDLVAFRAAVELLRETHRSHIIDEVYRKAKTALASGEARIPNYVKEIYEPFTEAEISAKISLLLRPVDLHAEVEVIFQTLQGLHDSCPNHKGDWYFSGNYPTPGGSRVVNRSFVNFIEGRNERAY